MRQFLTKTQQRFRDLKCVSENLLVKLSRYGEQDVGDYCSSTVRVSVVKEIVVSISI